MSDRSSHRPPPGPPPAWWLSAGEYAVVGGVGLVLLAIGVYSPILAHAPDATYLRILFAIAGGFLVVLGFGRWNVLRVYPGGGERHPRGLAESMPSFRSYSPGDSEDPEVRRRLESSRRLPFAVGDGSGWFRGGAGVVAILVLVGMVLAGLPLTVGGASASSGASTPLSSSPLAVPAVTTAAPIPTCTPFYPVYGSVNGLYPPLPKFASQSPCKVDDDQAHATFSSPDPDSGAAVVFPVHLPGGGTNLPSETYAAFYLGIVVQGNPSSVDGQSYAELTMTPGLNLTTGAVSWNLDIAIWSLVLNTDCDSGLNFSWLGGYGCVVDEVGSGNGHALGKTLTGNTTANVTFVGSPSDSSNPLQVWFNDTTTPADSVRWTANAASTGTDAFLPYYAAACPDACDLNWSTGFGLGVGVELCDDMPSCFSYNATTQLGTSPYQVGSPEFWTGLAYNGEYLYVSTESSTGACGAVGGVASCPASAEVGDYPLFTFNGTTLDFGANYSWTTEDFGGVQSQFNAYGTATDFTPIFLDLLTNSSRAGFVAPGVSLNVSVRAQTLGTLQYVNLSYQVPGGSLTNTSMRLVSGSTTDGIYNSSIPAAGSNGTISFRTSAVNRAGGAVVLPPEGSPAVTVVRSAIPLITAVLEQVPATCGGISINGSGIDPNGTIARLLAGVYPIRSAGCYPYVFTGWRTSGGLTIVAGDGASTAVELHADGTVAALWNYVIPHDAVSVAFSPSTCGEVVLNGTTIPAASPGPVSLLDGGTYSLSSVACGGHSFAGWEVSDSTNLSILGSSLTLHGNGTLTATFVETAGSAPVVFETDPSGCGGVLLNRVGYVSNESVNLIVGDSYPVGPAPCYGWGFNGSVSTAGELTVSGGLLSVSGGGVVEYSYYELTLVTVLTSPSICGGIDWDGTFEANGAVLNVTNHTVHSVLAEPCGGSYVEGFQLTGGLSLSGTVLTVSGPGSIEAVFRAGTQEYFVGFITEPFGCGAIEFDSSPYTNSQYADVAPDSVHIVSAIPCTNYGFVGWTTSGGVTVVGRDAYVNQSGSIEAVFHPLVAVTVETSPASCGTVVIAEGSYASGEMVLLANDASYTITAVPCLYDVLSSWQTSGGATIANGSLSVSATAIVVAVYVPAIYSVGVSIDPGACGDVNINGVAYANNSSVGLTAGVYPVTSAVCPGYEPLAWQTGGGVNLSGGSLDVAGSGTLVEVDGPVPPTLSLSVPTTLGVGSVTYFAATVAVPVPPFNYTYSWNFGDGTTVATPSNFTSHSYGSTGVYRVTVTVTDPFGRTATASTNVTVVAGSAAPYLGIGAAGIALIVVAAAVVVAGAAVAIVRSRRPPSDGATGNSPGGGEP